jgi:hypothetical protein
MNKSLESLEAAFAFQFLMQKRRKKIQANKKTFIISHEINK